MALVAVSGTKAPIVSGAAIEDRLGCVLDGLSTKRLVSTAVCHIDEVAVALAELGAGRPSKSCF